MNIDRNIIEVNDDDFIGKYLRAEITTSEICGYYMKEPTDFTILIDSIKNVYVPIVPDGLYDIQMNPEGKLYIAVGKNNVNLCYNEELVVKNYLRYTRVLIMKGKGRISQKENFLRFINASDMFNLSASTSRSEKTKNFFPLDSYHFLKDLVIVNIGDNKYKYHTDSLSKSYLNSVLNSYNTEDENEVAKEEDLGIVLKMNPKAVLHNINSTVKLATMIKRSPEKNAEVERFQAFIDSYMEKPVTRLIMDLNNVDIDIGEYPLLDDAIRIITKNPDNTMRGNLIDILSKYTVD